MKITKRDIEPAKIDDFTKLIDDKSYGWACMFYKTGDKVTVIRNNSLQGSRYSVAMQGYYADEEVKWQIDKGSKIVNASLQEAVEYIKEKVVSLESQALDKVEVKIIHKMNYVEASKLSHETI